MSKSVVGRALAFLVALFAVLRPGVVHAQQDGPRGYLLAPKGTHAAVLASAFVDANQTPNDGPVVVDSDIASVVSLYLYAHPLTIAGNFASVFVAQPVGIVDGSVDIGGQSTSNTSGGFGDLAFGTMIGLVGMPALPIKSTSPTNPVSRSPRSSRPRPRQGATTKQRSSISDRTAGCFACPFP